MILYFCFVLGYVRYLNDRREVLRAENPNLQFAEITKILANEWNSLQMPKKQQYLDAADKDKERYNKELDVYKKTDAYKQFTKSQQLEKKLKLENAQNKKDNDLVSILLIIDS